MATLPNIKIPPLSGWIEFTSAVKPKIELISPNTTVIIAVSDALPATNDGELLSNSGDSILISSAGKVWGKNISDITAELSVMNDFGAESAGGSGGSVDTTALAKDVTLQSIYQSVNNKYDYEFKYDANKNVIVKKFKDGGVFKFERRYTYDANGNVTANIVSLVETV